MTAIIYAGLPGEIKHDFLFKVKEKTPMGIINCICEVLNLSYNDIVGKCRKREIVEARQIAIGLILEANPKLTLKKVGRIFKRDHSTIIYARNTYNDLLLTNKIFKSKVKQVKRITHYD